MKDLFPPMFDYKEYEHHPQADRGHGEEINRDDLPEVILEERFPGLGRRPFDASEKARNRPFVHLDSELL
jgi:hypothetical protein